MEHLCKNEKNALWAQGLTSGLQPGLEPSTAPSWAFWCSAQSVSWGEVPWVQWTIYKIHRCPVYKKRLPFLLPHASFSPTTNITEMDRLDVGVRTKEWGDYGEECHGKSPNSRLDSMSHWPSCLFAFGPLEENERVCGNLFNPDSVHQTSFGGHLCPGWFRGLEEAQLCSLILACREQKI